MKFLTSITFAAIDRVLQKLGQVAIFAFACYFVLIVLAAWASGAFERLVR